MVAQEFTVDLNKPLVFQFNNAIRDLKYYVMYDCTHYYLHLGQPCGGLSKDLKKYHLNHHFRIQDKGFGITSSFWDKVFGTLPQVKQA